MREPKVEPGLTMEKEYESLRTEIERRSTTQQAIVALNLTAVAAIAALALRAETPSGTVSTAQSRTYFLTLLLPYVGFALGRLWLDHHQAILGLGRYIRTTLETRSDALWETALEARYRRLKSVGHYMFFVAYAAVFVGPSVGALAATVGHTGGQGRGLMWGFAVAFAAVNSSGWVVAAVRGNRQSLTFSRLRTIFEPRVRARLDWERLAEQKGVKVAIYYVDDQSDFEGWWMPWYYKLNAAGQRVEVQERDGESAIAVLDCGNLPALANGSWRPKVETVGEFDAEMERAPVRFDLCTYSLGSDQSIVLDGNHHLAAALRSGNSFVARVFEIRGGPRDDAGLLPDLRRDWNRRGIPRDQEPADPKR